MWAGAALTDAVVDREWKKEKAEVSSVGIKERPALS
jgi:hypothetical protein